MNICNSCDVMRMLLDILFRKPLRGRLQGFLCHPLIRILRLGMIGLLENKKLEMLYKI
jgi:hypothetical protein